MLDDSGPGDLLPWQQVPGLDAGMFGGPDCGKAIGILIIGNNSHLMENNYWHIKFHFKSLNTVTYNNDR